MSVDTIAQRDLLSGTKLLPHGKLVRVNSTPYGVKYYAWNQITQQWDEETFGGKGPDGSPYLTESAAEGKYLTIENAQETYIEKGDASVSGPKWEPI